MMEKNGNITENTPQSNGQTTHEPADLQQDLLYKASQAGCGCSCSCNKTEGTKNEDEANPS